MSRRSQIKTVSRTQNINLPLLIGITILLLGTTMTSASADGEVTWWNISKFLREFVNNGLVANKLQEQLDQGYVWERKVVNGTEKLKKVSQRVSSIFQRSIDDLKRLKRAIEREYDTWPEYTREQVNNSSVLCCERGNDDLSPDGCALLARPEPAVATPTRATHPPHSVIRELKKAEKLYAQSFSQYFAFNDGSLYMYPSRPKEILLTCDTYDPRLRYFFTQSQSPEAREVVLVVDKGVNTEANFLMKVVQRILKAPSHIDRVSLCLPDGDKCRTRRVGSNAEPTWPRQDYPLGIRSLLGDIVAASQKNKKLIQEQFEAWLKSTSEPPSSFSSRVAALSAGYALFQVTSPSSNPYHSTVGEYHRVLVYVTAKGGWDGWNTQEQLVNQLNITLRNSVHVVIHPIQEAATGLKDEDIMDYNNITIKIAPFTNLTELYSIPTSIESFGLNDPDRPVIPMPYWDAFGMGYIMSICFPLTKGTDFLGSVCTDLSIANLLETETNVDDIEDAYIFIVNSLGYTLMHPLLPSSHSISQDPSYVTISSLEQAEEVQPILEAIVQQRPGTKDLLGVQVEPIGQPRGSGVPVPVKLSNRHFRYQWVQIDQTDLTIALVLPLEDGTAYSNLYKCVNESTCRTGHFQYHRDRASDHRTLCKFFGTEVTEDMGLIKFAPTCFLDVLSYLKNETSEQITRLYNIFTGTIPYDEVLRSDLQGSVRLLEAAENLWRQQLDTYPELNDDIGARYMGTADGVFISFPGTSLRQAYDHRKRPWWLRAVSNPERASITMTTPFCDEWGAGMVYTITKALHDLYGNPVAVVSGDITLQYVMKTFKTQVSHCTKATCLLVDRMGYVVLKSDWSTSNTIPRTCQKNTDVQAAHLNRLAPDIARDMIASGILKRRACHDYEQDLTFYYWSLGLRGHQTLYNGPSYIAHKIAQTSLYLIVRTEGTTRANCNCDPYLRGEAVRCHDTCALECECPCVAGPDTQPCHNPEADVHRVPVPACKPGGLKSVRAKNGTSLPRCSRQYQICADKNIT